MVERPETMRSSKSKSQLFGSMSIILQVLTSEARTGQLSPSRAEPVQRPYFLVQHTGTMARSTRLPSHTAAMKNLSPTKMRYHLGQTTAKAVRCS